MEVFQKSHFILNKVDLQTKDIFTKKYFKQWPIKKKKGPVITSHQPLFIELPKIEKISHMVSELTNFSRSFTIIFNIKPANNKKCGII